MFKRKKLAKKIEANVNLTVNEQLTRELAESRMATRKAQGAADRAANQVEELKKHATVLFTEYERKFAELESNGVATAINKLNEEVFKDRKETEMSDLFGHFGHVGIFTRNSSAPEKQYEPTLSGKIDAVIEHLGLDLNITEKKVTPSKVVAKKVTKKKSRK